MFASFKNRAADEAGFTLLEIAIAVGAILILSAVSLVGYTSITSAQHARVVSIAAETGYGMASSGIYSAEEVEEKISMDGAFTVHATQVPVSGKTVGLVEPCITVDGFGQSASYGDCA